MNLYESYGILRYTRPENAGGYKLVAEIDKEITNYYRALVPKSIVLNSQMYAPHISIVRKETPVKLELWDKYEGEKIRFNYSNIIHFGEVYCWLNVWSKELEKIRLELGLPVSSPYTRPPDGFDKTFHTTIGNMKKLTQL